MSINQQDWNIMHDIMLYQWDPMGICEIREAEDQYDIYIPSLYFLLKSKASSEHIINHLIKLENEHMGLSGNIKHTKKIAALLVEKITNC